MINITPHLINDYFYCKNKLLLTNLIKSDNSFVRIGTILDLDNESKVKLGNFEIDEINHNTKTIIEYKKRISNFNGSKLQLLYYMYLTKNIFQNYSGKLIGIEDKKEFSFKLTNNNIIELENILNDIKIFIDKNEFDLSLLEESKCVKCGLYDFCYS